MFMECTLVMMAVQGLLFSPLVKSLAGRHIIAPAFLAMAVGLSLLPGTADFGALSFLVGLVAASAGILIPMLAYRVSLDARYGPRHRIRQADRDSQPWPSPGVSDWRMALRHG
jgi:hypothetical protein